MQRTYDKYKGNGLVIIGLGFQDTKANLINFAKEMKIENILLAFDTDGHISAKYGIPYGAGVIFIDRNGIVLKRFSTGFNEKEFLSETERIIVIKQ